jgi:hypothetical protein
MYLDPSAVPGMSSSSSLLLFLLCVHSRALVSDIFLASSFSTSAFVFARQQLEDEEDCSVAEWWDVQSDYQPAECGNDGSR